jgi:hypothetical protein
MEIRRKSITVETVQSIFGTDPDIAIMILTDFIDKSAGKSL